MKKMKKMKILLMAIMASCFCLFGATACENILDRGDRVDSSTSSSSSATEEEECNNHNFIETVVKQATCTTAGKVEVSCSKCDYKATKSIKKLGHSYVEVAGKKPTCETDGWYEYEECGRCGDYVCKDEDGNKVTKANNKIEKLGHNPNHKDSKKANCMEKAYCGVCGKLYGEKDTSHQLQARVMAAQEVSCEAEGWEAYTYCGYDGCTYTTKITQEKLYHEGEKDENGNTLRAKKSPNTVEETCTTRGYCGDCGRTYGEALGHSTDTTKGSCLATCTEKAYCGVCKQSYGTALGHDLKKFEEVQSTCTEKGNIEYWQCARCSKVKIGDSEVVLNKANAELAPLGHDFVAMSAVEPTCEEIGWTAGTRCDRCQTIGVQPQIVNALGHDGRRAGQKTKNDLLHRDSYYPICGSVGYCGICKTKYTDLTTKTHQLITVEAQQESCGNIGWNEFVYCVNPGCTYSTFEQNIIPAATHTLQYFPRKAPTCTENGYEEGSICVYCQELTVIPAIGHDLECTRNENSRPMTCEEQAYCGDCKTYYGELPHGHHKQETAPTCTEKATCSICKQEYGDYGHVVRPNGTCMWCGEYVRKDD